MQQTRAVAVLLELGKTTPENRGTFYEGLQRVTGAGGSIREMTKGIATSPQQ